MSISKRMGLLVIAGTIVVCGSEIGERFSIPGIYSVIPSAEASTARCACVPSRAPIIRR